VGLARMGKQQSVPLHTMQGKYETGEMEAEMEEKSEKESNALPPTIDAGSQLDVPSAGEFCNDHTSNTSSDEPPMTYTTSTVRTNDIQLRA
jgi:hypothetical protein